MVEETKHPVCFPMPSYRPPDDVEGQASELQRRGKHQLHGADDLISLFGLKSLWERSVKPYASTSRTTAAKHEHSAIERARAEGEEGVAGEEAPKVMEKTYVDYVRDLPGRVRPPKRTISRYQNALAAAAAAGQVQPPHPVEVAGRTTMRDIVFRPETTVQRVGPFEEDALRAAFTVEAGDVPNIDLSLLESDEVERQTPSKKKKKRKHQRDPTDRSAASDENAAKRSRLTAMVSGRSSQQRQQ